MFAGIFFLILDSGILSFLWDVFEPVIEESELKKPCNFAGL
jgi:hypothetical protein